MIYNIDLKTQNFNLWNELIGRVHTVDLIRNLPKKKEKGKMKKEEARMIDFLQYD